MVVTAIRIGGSLLRFLEVTFGRKKDAKGKAEKESFSISLAEFLSIGRIPWIPTRSKRSFWMMWSESPAPGWDIVLLALSVHCSPEKVYMLVSRGDQVTVPKQLVTLLSRSDSAFPSSAEEQGDPDSHFRHVSCFLKSFSIKPYPFPAFPSPLFPGCVGLPHPEEILEL